MTSTILPITYKKYNKISGAKTISKTREKKSKRERNSKVTFKSLVQVFLGLFYGPKWDALLIGSENTDHHGTLVMRKSPCSNYTYKRNPNFEEDKFYKRN